MRTKGESDVSEYNSKNPCRKKNLYSRRSWPPAYLTLLNPVVRSFFGDDDVVHVTLPQSSGGNADKARFRLHLLDRAAAAISHAGLESAHQLVHQIGQRPFRSHA